MPWEVSVLGSSSYMIPRSFHLLPVSIFYPIAPRKTKLHTILAFLSVIGLKMQIIECIYAV